MKRKSNIRKTNRKALIAGVALAALMIGGTLAAFLPSNRNTGSNRSSDVLNPNEIIQKLYNPVVQNASALGSSSASITLIEFGDYHCQSCAKFYRETGEQLFNNFLKTGQIRFLFKDYIINDNNSSTADTSFLATEASYCAADQGKYWQYHNALYDFSQTANTTQWATKDNLKQLARNVGIANILQFSNCLESHKYTKTVNENNNFARSIGVQTIPTFVLLSQRTKPLAIQGAQSYSIFEQAIREIQSASAQP